MTISVSDLEGLVTSARFDRGQRADIFNSGVIGAGDLKVTSGGSKDSIIAVGTAYIPGNLNAGQGTYRMSNSAAITRTHDAAVTNPRVDQIIAYVRDANELGSGALNDGIIDIAKGTEASGAQVSNPLGAGYRSGAVLDAALPKNAIRLADVLVPVGAGAIPGGNFIDRRPWARGQNVYMRGTSGAQNPGGGTLNAAYPGNQVVPELTFTGEFSGLPVEVEFFANVGNGNGASAGIVGLGVTLDGALPAGIVADNASVVSRSLAAANADKATLSHPGIVFTPTAGRHTIAVTIWNTANNAWVNGNIRGLKIREFAAVLTASQ